MTEHRRQHRRYSVELWAIEQGSGFQSWHRVSNLSRDGLFFETATPLPAGTLCALDLELPDGRTVRADAAVVHATASFRETGIGCRIVNVSPEARSAIESYLGTRTPYGPEATI